MSEGIVSTAKKNRFRRRPSSEAAENVSPTGESGTAVEGGTATAEDVLQPSSQSPPQQEGGGSLRASPRPDGESRVSPRLQESEQQPRISPRTQGTAGGSTRTSPRPGDVDGGVNDNLSSSTPWGGSRLATTGDENNGGDGFTVGADVVNAPAEDSSAEAAQETDLLVPNADNAENEPDAERQQQPRRSRFSSFIPKGRKKNAGSNDVNNNAGDTAGDVGAGGGGAMQPHRPVSRLAHYSIFDFLLQSNLQCGMGYRIEPFHREGRFEEANPGLRLDTEAEGLGVGIRVRKLQSYGADLVGIVKPVIKIHAVSIETGYYLRSRSLPATAPATTRPVHLIDTTTAPVWNQELVLDAYFEDLVSEDSLLLFELLDDKPSLRTSYSNISSSSSSSGSGAGGGGQLVAKRIAWGYLLPVGTSGEMNVGFSDDWKYSVRTGAAGNLDADHDDGGHSVGSRGSRGSRASAGSAGAGSAGRASSRRRRRSGAADADAHADESAAADDDGGREGPERDEQEGDGEGGGGIPGEEDGKNAGVIATSSSSRSRRVAAGPGGRDGNYPWHKPSADKAVRVQLYHYRQYDGMFGLIQRKIKGWPDIASYSDNGESSYPGGVPEVYVQWRLQRRLPIHGAYLSIRSGPRPAALMPYYLVGAGAGSGDVMLTNASGESAKGDAGQQAAAAVYARYLGRRGKQWAGLHGAPQRKGELARLRAQLLKRTRGHREPCVVPDKLVYRLDVGTEGAMVVSFSPSGHILAIAAKTIATASVPLSTEAETYSLIFFDTDLNEQVWVEESAHHAVIYDIKWTRNDRYLLTCSGDGTCKVWDMLPMSFRSSNTMGFGALNAPSSSMNGMAPSSSFEAAGAGGAPPPVDSGKAALHAASMHPPSLVFTLAASPPVYTYCGVFCDQPGARGGANVSTAAHTGAGAGAGGDAGSVVGGGNDSLAGTELASSVGAGGGGGPGSGASVNVMANIYNSTSATVPRIITGAADGKLRVWDGADMAGYIHVTHKDAAVNEIDYSPHEGQVNSIVIDERSRYMISGDSFGDILAWRQDANGWYQLLRKFKREAAPSAGPSAAAGGGLSQQQQTGGGGILSLTMHPEKHKGQMLVLQRQPAQLKMINMSTYKTHCNCMGFGGYAAAGNHIRGGLFNRAQLSADGRYAMAGCSVKGEDGLYQLRVWETITGKAIRSPLSGMLFPYPVRSISWHPTQHLVAVAMVGQGAAVAVYSGDRENLDRTLERMSDDAASAAIASAAASASAAGSAGGGIAGPPGPVTSSSGSSGIASLRALSKAAAGASAGTSAGTGPSGKVQFASAVAATAAGSTQPQQNTSVVKSDKAREMLEKIRAAKAAKAAAAAES